MCFFSHFLDFITFTFYDLFAEIAYFPFRRREKAKRKFGVLLLVPLFSLSCYCCSLLVAAIALSSPHSPLSHSFHLSLSHFLCFSLSLPLVSFSVFLPCDFVANSINVVVNRFCIERCLPFPSLLPSPSLVSLALQVLSVFSQSASCTLGTLCTCQCLCVCMCMREFSLIIRRVAPT